MSTEITICGNLVVEPKITRVGERGVALTKFRVASSRRRRTNDKDQNGNDVWADTDQLYIDVACWGDLAVNAAVSLFRGCPVVLVGRLLTETWEGEEGGKTVTRSKIVMRASHVAFDLANFQINSRKTTNVEHTAPGTAAVDVKTLDDLVPDTERRSAEDELPPRHTSPLGPSPADTEPAESADFDDSELVSAAAGDEGRKPPF